MSWSTARKAIRDELHGLTTTVGSGYGNETLTAFEFPQSSVQTSLMPYAYVIPPGRNIGHASGKLRVTTFDTVRVRFILGGTGSDLEQIARRMEAWVEKLAGEMDGAITFGSAVDVVTKRDVSELSNFPTDANSWGFDLELGLRLSEAKTLAA